MADTDPINLRLRLMMAQQELERQKLPGDPTTFGMTPSERRTLEAGEERLRTPIPGHVEGTARNVLQNLTMGFGDEIVGNVRGALDPSLQGQYYGFEGRRDAAIDQERRKQAAYTKEYPVSSTITGLAAGAVPAVMGAAAMPTAGAIGALGTGAVEGFLHGMGTGEGGVMDRLPGAVPEMAIGAVTSGVGAPVVSRASGNVARNWSANRIANRLDMSRAASDTLRTAATADDYAGRGGANIAAAGPNGMLADAGYASRRLLDSTMQTTGPGSGIARNAVERRVGQATQQVGQALDTTLGNPRAPMPTRPGDLHPLYEAAYGTPVDYARPEGQIIDNLVRTRVPQAAINEANNLMRLEGQGSRQIMADVAEDGTVTYRQMPDVRQLDYITRGLNEVADASVGQGRGGGQTNVGRLTGNLAREIRQNMRALVPAYGDALDTAGNFLRERSAREFGEEMLRPNFSTMDVEDVVGGFGNLERQRAAQGVRQYIDDVLANVKRTAVDPNTDAREALKALTDLSSRAARSKVRLVVGDAADEMFANLDEAGRAFGLQAGVRDNAATMARTAVDRNIRSATEDGLINAARRGEVLSVDKDGALARAIQVVTGATENDRRRMTDDVYEELATALTGPDPQRLVRLLGRTSQLPERADARARRMGALVGRSAGGIVQPAIGE